MNIRELCVVLCAVFFGVIWFLGGALDPSVPKMLPTVVGLGIFIFFCVVGIALVRFDDMEAHDRKFAPVRTR